jgi:Glycosyltransferases involved in cell wall biogenesis
MPCSARERVVVTLPSVSVVVPVFNGERTIGDMLKALTSQSPKPRDLEIIVVDNGSTDATREIVERYDGVTLLHESRRGPAPARNTGLRAANNEIVLHCDADTLPSRGWIAALTRVFTDPAVHLAAGKTLSFPPKTAPERYLAVAQVYEAEKNINRPVLPFVASMNMGVRRESALAIGGWTNEMMTAEDVDFSTRLLARFPGPIAYAPAAVLFHRNRTSDAALKKQAWTYGEGVADTYQRYPQVASWGIKQYAGLARTLVGRTIAPSLLRVASVVGIPTDSNVEHAHYHRMWTWWFWGGFASFYRNREYRPMWGAKP